jgi:hypothetical protein
MPKGTSTKVWRISESTPMGEWVDLAARPHVPQKPKIALPDVEQGTWVRSSYDLLDGVEINEAEDSVPAELFDELFGAPPSPSKAPRT